VTAAERDELLDAVERVEREVEAEDVGGTVGLTHDVLLRALADLITRAVRIWLVTQRVA